MKAKKKPLISYLKLRIVNPEAARIAVIEYLSSNGGNISQCAQIFGINRVVVYNIIKKNKEGNLKDRSKAPHHIPHKTDPKSEEIIVQVKLATGLSPKRLSYYLLKNHNLDIAYGTLRHILRRNR